MASAINVTVRLPFSSDQTLHVPTSTTIAELIIRVLRQAPDVQHQGSAQCIMYRGRILDDERTLSDLDIPNDAVLQIMPRPHRVVHRLRGADSGMHDPMWERQEDLEHEHHHIHEHVHTNVLISHVGFNNRRAQYSDIREMLVSLFQALGFSTNAINGTASIAAAMLISFDSGIERGHPSRPMLEAAWSAVRALQQQMSASVTNSNSNRPQTQASNDGHTSSSGASATPSHAPQTQTNPLTVSRSATPSTRAPPQPGTSEAPGRASSVHQLGSSTYEAGASSDLFTSAPSISVLPPHPPADNQNISDRFASARTADRLIPALGQLLSNLEYRLRVAPSFSAVIQGERVQDIAHLTELIGATAGSMTAVATLISSTLPDEDDDENDRNRRSSSRHNSSSQRRRQSRAQSASAGGANPSSSNQEGEANAPNSSQAQTGTGATPSTTGGRGNSQRSGGTNRTGGPRNRGNRHGNASRLRIPHNHSDDGEEEGNYDSYQELNASFLVRFVGYYYHSLAGADSADDSCPDDSSEGTAVDVLRGLYGNVGCDEPLNPFLRVLYYVMEMLTPLDFHKVCRGDFSPIAECRHDVWEIIEEELSEVAEDFIGPDDFEDYFVYFICEKLHIFIHIFDSHNRDNEGSLHDGDEDDICRHTMHFIHRMMLLLVDIFTGDMGDDEFATKLQDWFSDSFAGVVHALGEQTGQDWDSVIFAFRQACNEVGVAVLGGQCSIIFPLILNLFLVRARAAYDRIISESNGRRDMNGVTQDNEQQESEAEDDENDFDHSNCGPECPSRQAQEENDFDHSHCGSECPVRREREFEANRRSTRNHGVHSDEDLPDLVSDSDENASTDDGNFANSRNSFNRRTPTNSTHQGTASGPVRDTMEINQNVELDDQDFDDIVAELSREIESNSAKPNHAANDSDADFKELAMELEKEAATGPNKGSHSNQSGDQENIAKEKPSTNAIGSSTTLPAASMRRGAHVGPSLSTRRSPFVGSSRGHTSFSSTAVPITRRSTNYSGSSLTQAADEFDVLGKVAAKRWRSIVRNDENRMSVAAHDLLSRGYRYDVEPQRRLNDGTALKIVEEGLEAAAREVPVTVSERKELEGILRESSAECLEYIESEIQSRILDESDFSSNAYPSATSRFLGCEDTPE